MNHHRSYLVLVTILIVTFTAGCGGAVVSSASPASAASAAPRAESGAPRQTLTGTPGVAAPSPTARATDLPSRVVVADLKIDLPIISGDATLPGNPPDFPLCDVAQYLTTFPFPGRLGTTTWIYGHAREGMFLELLKASEQNDGASLIGSTVDVFSTGNVRYRYRIAEVLRHATDRSAAQGVPADQGRLILQTSEGPRGTVPKLQVIANLIETEEASAAEAQPAASPRACANE